MSVWPKKTEHYKEISALGNTEIEKYKFYCNKTNLTRFPLVKKIISALLVTCIIMIKLSNYI